MAERRMFAKTIVLSDAFLDMPLSARCLYFTLGMLADDDGFVNSPKSIMRQCGASDDDIKLLLSKKFIIAFDSGIIVIKHWRINNYLRSDRYSETNYTAEKALLTVEPNGGYTTGIPDNGIPSIGKDSIGKDSIGNNKRFTPPTIDDIRSYCSEKSLSVDPDEFFRYFSEGHWIDSKGNKVRNWKQKLLTWNNFKKGDSQHGNGNSTGHTEDGVSEWDIHYSI